MDDVVERVARNSGGRFLKKLRHTAPDSREWFIWSHYHHCWHRRSNEGGACGYTNDLGQAGIFVRAKAFEYHGDRNEAFHASEIVTRIQAEAALVQERAENLNRALVAALQQKDQ